VSGEPAAEKAYDHDRTRSHPAPILDLTLWRLRSQSALHPRGSAARDALGARGRARHDAKALGSRPEENADPPANGRTSIRNAESLDGGHPLPHTHARTGQYRDEPARAGLQSQANDEDHGNRTADRSDANLTGYPVSLARTFLHQSLCNPRAKEPRAASPRSVPATYHTVSANTCQSLC
jgi:hypothetical protein